MNISVKTNDDSYLKGICLHVYLHIYHAKNRACSMFSDKKYPKNFL